uniref:CHY-type domain-containing protein n=1 Tax=Setaria digitata TaxID=48799 RepID=A0A915PLX1_9BILA
MKRTKKKLERPMIIVEGQPLPEKGTCKHYKKSYRWFRFPCCGKLYPCDSCHNDVEKDHDMKLANRMVCGFCSKEQPFQKAKPCINCNENVTRVKSQFWEGGKGCRDQIVMSRNDRRKHANSLMKTVSKKQAWPTISKPYILISPIYERRSFSSPSCPALEMIQLKQAVLVWSSAVGSVLSISAFPLGIYLAIIGVPLFLLEAGYIIRLCCGTEGVCCRAFALILNLDGVKRGILYLFLAIFCFYPKLIESSIPPGIFLALTSVLYLLKPFQLKKIVITHESESTVVFYLRRQKREHCSKKSRVQTVTCYHFPGITKTWYIHERPVGLLRKKLIHSTFSMPFKIRLLGWISGIFVE